MRRSVRGLGDAVATGLILVRRGKLQSALRFGFGGGRITTAEIITDPARLGAIDLAVLA